MWGLPLFNVRNPAAVLFEIYACKKENPDCYVKCVAFDNKRGTESTVLSFLVHRPKYEP